MKLPWPKSDSAENRVPLRHHADLIPPMAGLKRIATSIGPAGEAVLAWSSEGDDAKTPISVHVTQYSDSGVETLISGVQIDFAHFFVQPLPGGRVLFVGSRCYWHEDGPESNALIFEDNTILKQGCLGDGISQLRTTATGDIWVGYFDEGVYGNFGWGGSGRAPIGAPGIVRFDNELTQRWAYPYDSPFGVIDDCYAMNVCGEDILAYYYSDFPIACISADVVEGWKTQVGGARALIADRDRACLVGGYNEDRHRLVIGELAGDNFEVSRTATLVMPDDNVVSSDAVIIGNGPELHVIADESWLKLDLSDL